MKNKPFLSICIPTYKRAESLEHVLNTLVKEVMMCSAPVEICVSDNGSKDGTYELLKRYAKRYNFIRIRRNKTNVGYDNNFIAVLKMANGEYCWPINDHAECIHGAITDLIETLKRNKPIACLLKNVDRDASHTDILFQKEMYDNSEFINAYATALNAVSETDPISGAITSYVFERRTLEKVLNRKKMPNQMYGWAHLVLFLHVVSQHKGKILVYKKRLVNNLVSIKKYKVFFPSEVIQVFMINRIKALDALPIDKKLKDVFVRYVENKYSIAYVKSLVRFIVVKDIIDKEFKERNETEKMLALGKYDFTLLDSVVISFLKFIIDNSILRKTAAYFLIKAVPALRRLHENMERYTKKELSTSIERDLPLDLNKNRPDSKSESE